MKTAVLPTKHIAQLTIQSPLLAQVTDLLGNRRYLAGQQAYEFLSHLLVNSTASEMQAAVAHLGLASITKRDLENPTEAALAVAAAALLDSTRGRRATVSEQLDLAMRHLDNELSAGW